MKEATGQPVTMKEVHTDQVVGRDGGASRQLDENHLQVMDAHLDRNATIAQSKAQKHK